MPNSDIILGESCFMPNCLGIEGTVKRRNCLDKVNFMPIQKLFVGNCFMPNCLGIGGIMDEKGCNACWFKLKIIVWGNCLLVKLFL